MKRVEDRIVEKQDEDEGVRSMVEKVFKGINST